MNLLWNLYNDYCTKHCECYLIYQLSQRFFGLNCVKLSAGSMGRSFESQSARGSTDTFYDTHLRYLLTGMAIYLRGNMVEWFQNRFDFVLKAIRQINDQCLTQCPTTPCVYFCQWTHFWESMMINIWSARQISNQIGPGYRFSPAGAISNIKMHFSPSLRNKNGLFSPWCNFLPL